MEAAHGINNECVFYTLREKNLHLITEIMCLSLLSLSLQPAFPKSVKILSNRQRRNSKTAPARSYSLLVQSKYNSIPSGRRAAVSSS